MIEYSILPEVMPVVLLPDVKVQPQTDLVLADLVVVLLLSGEMAQLLVAQVTVSAVVLRLGLSVLALLHALLVVLLPTDLQVEQEQV
jgi:hypothetical protein